jgi:hypothetical protein
LLPLLFLKLYATLYAGNDGKKPKLTQKGSPKVADRKLVSFAAENRLPETAISVSHMHTALIDSLEVSKKKKLLDDENDCTSVVLSNLNL